MDQAAPSRGAAGNPMAGMMNMMGGMMEAMQQQQQQMGGAAMHQQNMMAGMMGGMMGGGGGKCTGGPRVAVGRPLRVVHGEAAVRRDVGAERCLGRVVAAGDEAGAQTPQRVSEHRPVFDAAVPRLRLEGGDRLEPSPSLPDTAAFPALALPAQVVFWRERRLPGGASLDSVVHENPLFAEDLGTSPSETLTVDALHSLHGASDENRSGRDLASALAEPVGAPRPEISETRSRRAAPSSPIAVLERGAGDTSRRTF